MQNDPELSGKYLGTITQDFILVCNTIKEAAYQIRKREISDYPIFPICKEQAKIGKMIIEKSEAEISWNINFSMLEEFIQRQLITEDKIAEFQNTYKDPDEFCCLFVIEPDFVNFVYIPYPED